MPTKTAVDRKPHIALKPVKGAQSFLFHGCWVEQERAALTVTLPKAGAQFRVATVGPGGGVAWSKPAAHTAEVVTVACAGSPPRRHDRADYPPAPMAAGPRVVFTGGATFARVALPSGPALLVQATVRSIKGLRRGAAWVGFDTVELQTAKIPAAPSSPTAGGGDPTGGGSSGPHLPFP